MIRYFCFISFTLLFFSGCISTECKPTIEFSKEVQKLGDSDKIIIYRAIQDQINFYKLKGDRAYSDKHYYDALNFYELVNFYEGYDYIPKSKLEEIRKNAKIKSNYHYKKASKSKNITTKLYELNIVMMNNPNYKDTKKLYTQVKLERKNIILLNRLEDALQAKLLNFQGDTKSIISINADMQKLASYEYKNTTVLKVKELLASRHKELLQNAISLYRSNKIRSAKKSFLQLNSMYKNDKEINKYLKKIELLQSKKYKLNQASLALSKGKYKLAINYANKVLRIDSKNIKAKEIIVKSKKLLNVKVNTLLKKGKYNYNRKKLDKAKQIFKEVLEIDENDKTAIMYIKKIERQLHTINSLE